jgi:hypothetical protein
VGCVTATPVQPLLGSVLAVLKAADERGFTVTRMKLVKLLYFADLAAVEALWDQGACSLKLTEEIDDPLPTDSMATIRRVVAEHGAKNATALKELSYRTPPMVEATAAGERGVLLDLSRARRRKQVRDRIERARLARRDRPTQTRDQGVDEVLRAELVLAADSIQRVNAEVLGDR